MTETTQPDMMRAVVQDVYGGPAVLHMADVPRPTPGPQDVRVRVHAAAVNPVDAKVRRGGPEGAPVPAAPKILGWDGAGIVDAVGAAVTDFAPGDEVYFAGDIGRAGAYAEFVCVDARIVGRKPRTLDMVQAAAIPLTALTAWEGIFETFNVAPGAGGGRTLLIIGGAGGVGSIAIQLAKRVGNFHVIATASRPESAARCRELGADAVIDHSLPLAPQLHEAGYDGVAFIFSTATLDNFAQMVDVLKPLGHICVIQGGPSAQSVNVAPLMPKRGTLSFELMFTRPSTGMEPERQGAILKRVAQLLDDGVLATTLTTVLPWDEAAEAHRRIETEHTLGKIVLRVAN